MKTTLSFLLLLMISFSFILQSCQNKTENIEQKETQKAIKSDKNSTSENNEHPENIKMMI